MAALFTRERLRSRPVASAVMLTACLGVAGALAAGLVEAASAQAGATAAAATPAGFWSGTDSNYIGIPGPAPYREPAIGGSYGGYIGMIGNWAALQHCGGKLVFSTTDANEARRDLVSYHEGIGVGYYWFM